ncbi:flagellin [Alkalimarinus coralli]|uniref:flagellin N-terminal helical domain-containing protein n=1 Tax=Alkalimarinus coralli TaxID=2935863 RepID=UPI00202AC7C5|nr:flagellin [Alkalimarinus coralli]
MAITINGPAGAAGSQQTNNTNTQFNRISSGQRINSAADDAAGLAISNRMATQLSGLNTSLRNASDGISLVQVESGALDTMTDKLQRIRELSIQAGNGALNRSDREALQKEADQLLQETQQTLETARFNGVSLLNSDGSQSFQIGPGEADKVSVEGENIQAKLTDNGLFAIDLTSAEAASNALSTIDSSLAIISERNSELGAIANRFESITDRIQEESINTAEAKSRIADADIAKEASDLVSNQIKNQAQIAVQAQANGDRGLVLQLLS